MLWVFNFEKTAIFNLDTGARVAVVPPLPGRPTADKHELRAFHEGPRQQDQAVLKVGTKEDCVAALARFAALPTVAAVVVA